MGAGAYFADRTLPKKTSSTSAGLIPSALSTAAAFFERSHQPFLQTRQAEACHTFNRMRAKLSGREARKGATKVQRSVQGCETSTSIFEFLYPRKEPTGVRAADTM